jgi:predicted metal-dependent hydrolase
MSPSKGSLVIGTTTIPYSVKRSARRKRTVALIIGPGADLTVLAPAKTEIARIEAIARRRATWIIRKLADVRGRSMGFHDREFVDGEGLTYLGRQYRLRVSGTSATPSCKLRNGWLEVLIPPTSARGRRNVVARTVEDWYRTQARTKLASRIRAWSERMGIKYGRLLVTSPEKRWGSCDTSSNVRINWRIMMAPRSLVDYVLVHELCHVRHRNHSDAFWRLLASVMPDYERRRDALRKLGPRLSL